MVVGTSFAVVILAIIAFVAWAVPVYAAWTTRIAADADNAAEVTRAIGVAKANRVIGDSLKGQGEYLRYLWIQRLSSEDKATFYIPTDGMYPMFDSAWIQPGNATCGD